MSPTDHPLKRLVTLAAADVAAWLLGTPVVSVTTRPGELTATPDPLDSDLIFLVTLPDASEVILHLEFQGPGSKRPMPLRMLEYLTRLAVLYRTQRIVSVVIYLGGAGATDTGIYQRERMDGQPCLTWRYDVVRLWEIPGEAILALGRPALLPLLGQTALSNPQAVMTAAVEQIGAQTEGEQRTLLLSELLLLCRDTEVAAMVDQLIQQRYGEIDTPIMQKLRAEGEAIGQEKGRAEGEAIGQEKGRAEGEAELVLRLLTRRCGVLDATIRGQVQQLTQGQRLELAEALLDFQQPEDVQQWLAVHLPTPKR